ncbi:WD40-repeat-containing domain protein, partial [Baffinella frigidus]
LAGSSDKTCRLWDITRGDCVRLFKGLRAPVTAVSVSSCGKLLAAGADDGMIMVWDLAASKTVNTFKGHTGSVYSVDFSLGGGGLLASG